MANMVSNSDRFIAVAVTPSKMQASWIPTANHAYEKIWTCFLIKKKRGPTWYIYIPKSYHIWKVILDYFIAFHMIPSGHVIIPIQAFYNAGREEINGAAKKKKKGIKKKLLKFFSSFF